MKKIIISGVSVIFILIFASILMPVGSSSSRIHETGQIQITDENADQIKPIIFNEYIAWVDYRHDIDKKASYEDDELTAIYLYDLKKGEERLIISNNQSKWPMGFQQDTLFFAEYYLNGLYNNELVIRRHIISKNITEDVIHFYNRSSVIFADSLIYSQDSSWPNSTFYEFNISSGQERILIEHVNRMTIVGGSERYLVYVDVPELPCFYNLYIYDKIEGEYLQITFGYDTSPIISISGPNLLYKENDILYYLNLLSNEKIIISENINEYIIHNNTIACVAFVEDFPVNEKYFCLINLENGNEYHFTTFNTTRFRNIYADNFNVHGSSIVWSDDWDSEEMYEKGEFNNIYYYDFNDDINIKNNKADSDINVLILLIPLIVFFFLLILITKVFTARNG